MFRCLFSLLCFILLPDYLNAQILPADNALLNYRLIGFSVPKNINATEYLLEIAEGSIADDKIFEQHIIIANNSATNRNIQTVPTFGKKYSWRITYLDKNKKTIGKTKISHFATGTSNFTDSSKYRLQIITNKTPYSGLLFFSDNTHALYNLNGEVLWYLPEIPGINIKVRVRDLKLTIDGTITFLSDSDACEIDYNGRLLWKAPRNPMANGNFHHEFTKLNNGHYMVENYENFERLIPEKFINNVDEFGVEKKGGKTYKHIQCGTLVEYDIHKKIVWQWSSGKHFTDADFFTLRTTRGTAKSETHMNGFYFDQKNKFIYISFREMSRIVKIKYPSGEIVSQYGDNYAGNTKGGGYFFRGQHHCSINTNGNLCLYNNNTVTKEGIPVAGKPVSYVTILREPIKPSDTINLQWEFPCDIDSLAEATGETGGSVYELSDENLLVCMGSSHRCFIVTKQKEVIWNILTEMKTDDGTWSQFSNYKISPVEKKEQLELMIFGRNK